MTQSSSQRILVLSSDTGGGHRSAAAAIAAGVAQFVKDESCAVRVVRAIEESDAIAASLVRFYNWLLRNKQHWMRYLYWSMNRIRPETRSFFYTRCVGYVQHLFERWRPHVIVSVHPLAQHVVGRALQELRLAHRVPLVCVVTDPCYGFWRGWASRYVTLFLVASEAARDQLIDYGVAPERIRISGMPVHPKFNIADAAAAQAARRALGLDPEKFTVFLNAGWEGGGNIPGVFRTLIRGGLDIQVIFLTGRNEALRASAERLAAQAALPIRVVGACDHVERLMNAAHVIVSKSGGLTTFEALACGVPIIADAITRPMPQELGTATFISQRGAGVLLHRTEDIVPIVRRMTADAAHYAALRSAALGLRFPNAIRHIVQQITALLPAPVQIHEEDGDAQCIGAEPAESPAQPLAVSA